MIPIILYEDASLLVCEKPSGVPSQSDKTSVYDMVNCLKNYLHQSHPESGVPYLGLIHRLDRPVGGIMVFAKTPFAAKELSKQIQNRIITKKYLAVITSDLSKELGKEKQLLTDYLSKDSRTNLSNLVSLKDKNGKKAELFYRILAVQKNQDNECSETCPFLSLAEVELITGRHHQIRVQMASHLGGIWGDTKYNPLFQPKNFLATSCNTKKTSPLPKAESQILIDEHTSEQKPTYTNIALYAYDLSFLHPKTNKKLHFQKLPEINSYHGFPIKMIFEALNQPSL